MFGLLDIGGTKLLAATSQPGEPIAATVRRTTPRDGAVIAALGDMLDEARAGQSLEAIGVAVPGPFDREQGALLNPPGLSPAWHQLRIAAELGERFGCPVRLENDANCAALGEAHGGAGRDARLLVYYTVSTGIGTGVVRRGELVLERHDNEGGHQVLWPRHLGGPACDCGGWGCLEAIASGRAIARRHGRPGDRLEDQGAWDEVGDWLGLAVVNAVALLDCDVVVFGGGVAVPRWPRIEPALRASVARHLRLQPAPAIRLAELGEERNLIGLQILLGWLGS